MSVPVAVENAEKKETKDLNIGDLLKNLFEQAQKWLEENVFKGTQTAFSSFMESLGLSAPKAKPEDTEDNKNLPQLERVRRIIEKRIDDKKFHEVAAPAWRIIQGLSDVELDGTDRVELWSMILGLAEQESGYNPFVVNVQSGAFGLFQIMPFNFQDWGLKNGKKAGIEEQLGVAIPKVLGYYKQFNHNWNAVPVAWFSGPGNVPAFLRGDPKAGNKVDQGNKSVSSYHSDVVARQQKFLSEA